jgi:two-component system, sensor histidine kinase and response regulator
MLTLCILLKWCNTRHLFEIVAQFDMNRSLIVAVLIFIAGTSASQSFDDLSNQRSHFPDTAQVNALIKKAESSWRNGDNEKSLKESEEAFKMASILEYARGQGYALLHTGIVQYRQALYRESLENFNGALLALAESGEKKDMALIFHWLGNSHYRLSQYDKALTNYLKSLRLREETGDQQGIAFSYYNIANIYFDQKQFEIALNYHMRSLAIKNKLGDLRGKAFSFNNIANIYLELNQKDTALAYYRKAQVIFHELGNEQGIAYALGNIGKIYKSQQRYQEALEYMQQGLFKLQTIGDKTALIEIHNQLASVQVSLRQFSAAEKNLATAEAMAIEFGVEDQLVENYFEHARLDSARGNFGNAYQWLRKFERKKESLFNIEKTQQLARMQSSFDLDKKNQEILFLNKEKELQQTVGKNQLIIFLCSLFTMFVVAAVLIFFLKQKQRTTWILQSQKKYAEDLNRLNDRLFSIISHDLRAPLKSLTGVLQLAANHQLTERELTKLLSSIGDNTQHIIDLLDNLLNWAKGHLTGNRIHSEDISLNLSVQNVISLLKPMADQKQIQLDDKLYNSIRVHADKNMVELVLRNLISNAIKFTPSLGRVTVDCALDQNFATISIQDTGIGIPAAQIDKLFGTHNFTTRGTANEKGTGLGLILCQEFVEKNGGSIWVKSVETSGSAFYFTLPMAAREHVAVTA